MSLFNCPDCSTPLTYDLTVSELYCAKCGTYCNPFGLGELSEQDTSASYARDLRGVVRALWQGVIDSQQAIDLLFDTVRLGLIRAWAEGARECGIQPADYSAREKMELALLISQEQSYIIGLVDFVVANSKAEGKKSHTGGNRAIEHAAAYSQESILERVWLAFS